MKINLTSLKEGLNEINYEHSAETLLLTRLEEIGDSFNSPIKIELTINKVGSQFFLKVITDTTANFTCDRCLEKYNQKLHDEFRLVYSTEKKYVAVAQNEKGIRFLTSDTVEIDITDDIRESILITIPMKKICFEDCRGLCSECGINLNLSSCDHKSQKMDSRWEALKKLTV